KEINSKLCLRTDSSGNWQTANPVLLRGEIGVEEDTGRIKIGDGKTEWLALPYFLVGMTKDQILDAFFPINTVRITVGDVNPAETLGGVWQKAVGTQKTEFQYWVRME
ncbi:MAG: hypothetical protein NC548_58405, partial [Lachnospiraceae bacterium]|nr:hypothetical protein [Lachnospiraceae bacterium]